MPDDKASTDRQSRRDAEGEREPAVAQPADDAAVPTSDPVGLFDPLRPRVRQGRARRPACGS
jgi:hypothetical protein